MRWFWEWRLRVARKRLRKATNKLPADFGEDPDRCAPEIIDFSVAAVKVAELREKCESYNK